MSPLVESALEAIQERTNVDTGLDHPNDMNAAKQLFLILHKAGESLASDEISAWAEARGWSVRDAKQLGAVASKIGAGTKPKIEGDWWREDILEILATKQ